MLRIFPLGGYPHPLCGKLLCTQYFHNEIPKNMFYLYIWNLCLRAEWKLKELIAFEDLKSLLLSNSITLHLWGWDAPLLPHLYKANFWLVLEYLKRKINKIIVHYRHKYINLMLNAYFPRSTLAILSTESMFSNRKYFVKPARWER